MKRIYLMLLSMLVCTWVLAQKPIDKSNWLVIDYDSEESVGEGGGNGQAIHAIDGDLNTFWHTQWYGASPPYPHYITIDLGKSYDLIGMDFTARAGRTEGTPDTISIWTSTDNVSWDSIAGASFETFTQVHTIEFTASTRYIKVVGNSGQGDYAHMVCGEIDFLVAGAGFSADETYVPRHDTVNFTDESGNAPVEWEWIFEGGTPATSTEQNPVVIYHEIGSYDVTLISKPLAGDDSQNDTIIRENLIRTHHTAAFTVSPSVVNAGEPVTFTDASTSNPVAWEWTFPGGTPATSTEQNPVVSYSQPGNYDATLVISADAGDPSLNDTIARTAVVTVDIASISRDTWTIQYIDSELSSQPIDYILDGDPSTFWHDNWPDANKPQYPHTLIIDLGAMFDLSGFSYSPRPGGGNGTIKEYQMYITREQPENDFGASWGTPVHMGEWSAPWDVDRHEFFNGSTVGRYVVFYMLSDRNDNPSDASMSEFNMKGTLYGAAFKADKSEIFASQTIQFTDLSAGTPAAWNWTFEGGTPATSTEQNPKVKYTYGDTLDVQLIMTPLSGAANNDTVVKNDFIVVKDVPAYKSLEKDSWKLIQVDSEEPTGEGEGNGLGIHAIDGDPNTYWHTAWAASEPVHPHYLIIDLGENVEIVGFEYLPRSGGGNGTVAQYELTTSLDAEAFTLADSGTWTGDQAATQTEMFDSPVTGRFVKFTALSNRTGDAWTSCGEFNILVNIQGVEFSASLTTIEKGGMVDFIDFSAGDPSGWAWTFEGAVPASSSEQSPGGIQYNDLGVYSVSLTTSGGTDNGTAEKTGYITVDYRDIEVGYNGVLIDTVEFGDVLYNYTASDNFFTRGIFNYHDNKAKVYRDEVYKLKVTHQNYWGEEQRYQHAWIDWNNNGRYEESELVMAGNESVDVTVPADAVLGETQMRVAAIYHEPTSTDPYARISDGETEDYTLVIGEVSTEVPVADFSASVTALCEGYMVTYTDLTTNTPTGWSWTFEGGSPATSTQQNPTVYYETAGSYDVSLTASQASGSDDETKADLITVNAAPDVNAGDDVNACFGEEITLSASGADSYEWNNDVANGVPFVALAGEYIVIGTDAAGCTASDTLVVSVEAEISYTLTVGDDDILVDAVGATFQWIDCADGSEIPGETAELFEPTESGNYAVIITVGECSVTSECNQIEIVGVSTSFRDQLRIYPNPAKGMVNVALENAGARIRVLNLLGSTVYFNDHASIQEQITIETKGLYIIEIEQGDQRYTGKLIIE